MLNIKVRRIIVGPMRFCAFYLKLTQNTWKCKLGS